MPSNTSQASTVVIKGASGKKHHKKHKKHKKHH
jgi:hypothetical protein